MFTNFKQVECSGPSFNKDPQSSLWISVGFTQVHWLDVSCTQQRYLMKKVQIQVNISLLQTAQLKSYNFFSYFVTCWFCFEEYRFAKGTNFRLAFCRKDFFLVLIEVLRFVTARWGQVSRCQGCGRLVAKHGFDLRQTSSECTSLDVCWLQNTEQTFWAAPQYKPSHRCAYFPSLWRWI